MEDLLNRMQEITSSVARRAYEIFENNGRPFGTELADWFKAETELLHPVHIEMAESDNAFKVRAEVPGFSAKEIEISAEPQKLTISGKRETKKEERKDEKTVYTERCSDQIFRMLVLPAEVNADKVTATVKDGVLEIELPKAEPRKKIQIVPKPG
jgi:HSP20 family protein